jgi:hypothetical protein
MAFEQRSLDDYIDVAQRIADFREKYPEGTLCPADPKEPFRLLQAQGFNKDGSVEQQTFLVVVAAAYRSPADCCPGVGMAWEVFPGRTPYTRGSELQNAETSAWGRAIIAVGASDSKRGIASREEVRNRQAEREDGLPANRDGSTSRSRVTDEELAATGQMTKAQLAEHNKLVRETRPAEPGRVKRSAGGVPICQDTSHDRYGIEGCTECDPWTVQERPKPAGWLLSEAFARLGVFDRKERLEQCSEIVGRPIASSKELEPIEVGAVLEWLQRKSDLPEVAK